MYCIVFDTGKLSGSRSSVQTMYLINSKFDSYYVTEKNIIDDVNRYQCNKDSGFKILSDIQSHIDYNYN